MKPRRTHTSNAVYRLSGGTEDNDLWVTQEPHPTTGEPLICSVWEPTPEERVQLAAGANIELVTWGEAHPPVNLQLSTIPLGRPPRPEPGPETGT